MREYAMVTILTTDGVFSFDPAHADFYEPFIAEMFNREILVDVFGPESVNISFQTTFARIGADGEFCAFDGDIEIKGDGEIGYV